MHSAIRMLAAVALLAGGCSMFQDKKTEFKPVSDADFGRLSPRQLGPVHDARELLFASRDDVARAKLRLQQAENEIELARADQSMVKAAQHRAQAELKVANASNDPATKAKAQEALAQAELQARASRAHLSFANQLSSARQAELDSANKLVKVREAELEQSKLTALQQAKIPAATKYDTSLFGARVAAARKEHLEADAEAKARLADAQQGENTWRTLHAQYEDRVQSQSSATASGASTGQGAQEPAQQATPTPKVEPPAPAAPATPAPAPTSETTPPK